MMMENGDDDDRIRQYQQLVSDIYIENRILVLVPVFAWLVAYDAALFRLWVCIMLNGWMLRIFLSMNKYYFLIQFVCVCMCFDALLFQDPWSRFIVKFTPN